ncbi:MAG: ribonuclease III [Clostridia bacterium]|nr:ribonuclease III [Clostridia bacterium]
MDKDLNPNAINPLALAFLGDTVFDFFVRRELVTGPGKPVNELHRDASAMVCAGSQAAYAREIMPCLSEEETEIFKRGRNAHPGSSPKNQSSADYHYATGLECLFGWLYLKGRTDRAEELYEMIKRTDENEKR